MKKMENSSENSLPNVDFDVDKENCTETEVHMQTSENEKCVEIHHLQENTCTSNDGTPSENINKIECLKSEDIENTLREQNVLGNFIEEAQGENITNEDVQHKAQRKTSTIEIEDVKNGSCCKLVFILSSATIWISFLVYCYLYLTTVCVPVELWCPNPTHTFTAQACCSSLWLNLGSTIGLGNECSIDMAEMEAGCPMYDCYKNASTADLNVNGCSYVPNTLFNEAACNIHDLCYITPGSTKKACDDTFVENIILIYCDNVNVFERIACRGRAQLAGAVVSAIDSFYDDSAELRATCNQTSNSLAIFTGMLATFILTLLSACSIHAIVKRLQSKEILQYEDEIDDTCEYQFGQEFETNETDCYCDEPMDNCNLCDEVFIKDLSLECDINELIAQEENTPQESYSEIDVENADFESNEKVDEKREHEMKLQHTGDIQI